MPFGVLKMQTMERTELETRFSKNGITTTRYQITALHTLNWWNMRSCLKWERCCLEPGANNTKVVGSVNVGATDFRVGLYDPCGSLPTQNILQLLPQQLLFKDMLLEYLQNHRTTNCIQSMSLEKYIKRKCWFLSWQSSHIHSTKFQLSLFLFSEVFFSSEPDALAPKRKVLSELRLHQK